MLWADVFIGVVSRDCFDVQAILEFFSKFIDITSADLNFVVDDISEEDSSAVGVTWHLGTSDTIESHLHDCQFLPLPV